MTAFAINRTVSVAWGISLVAHGGQAQPEMRILALQTRPLCLQTRSARLCEFDEEENIGSEHVVIGRDDDERAWIRNHCQTLSCRVNGAEMRPGERWMLADRDEVTVGLTKLLVVQSDSVQQWEAWAGRLPSNGTLDQAAALEALRALDAPHEANGVLAPRERHRNHGIALTDTLPLGQQDPLQTLATEFDQAIQGVHQGLRAFQTTSANTPASALPPPPDPFDAPPAGVPTRMLLEGLLPERTDIETILGEMNDFEAGEFFAPPAHRDVLRLLADKADDPLGTKALAAISRREHHDLSIDSYFEQNVPEPTQ